MELKSQGLFNFTKDQDLYSLLEKMNEDFIQQNTLDKIVLKAIEDILLFSPCTEDDVNSDSAAIIKDILEPIQLYAIHQIEQLLHPMKEAQQEGHYNVFIIEIIDENARLMVLDMNDYSTVEFVGQRQSLDGNMTKYV